jgi:hypothetical protein
MNEPCGDITCWCCYPEFRHECERPDNPADQEFAPCPVCGAVWLARRRDSMPAHIRARMDRSHAVTVAALRRRGAPVPAPPVAVWQQVSPATRIPGSLT